MPLTSETARTIGKKGGAATVARHGAAHMRMLGKKGWAAMVARHGREVLAANGKKGFQTTANRYFGGDRAALVCWLVRAGLAAQDPVPSNGVWQRRQPWPEPVTSKESVLEEHA